MDVHFNEKSMATVLSLKEIADLLGYRLTINTSKKRSIFVETDTVTGVKFRQCGSGLYLYDMAQGHKNSLNNNNQNKSDVIDHFSLHTVNKNRDFWNKNKIKKAEKSRRYQSILFWSLESTYLDIIKNNWTNNYDINADDAHRVRAINRPAKALLQEK